MTYTLAIDQGTTSSRAILFDGGITPIASAQQEFTQHFPNSGWVEHDAVEIWEVTLKMCRDVVAKAGISASDIAAIGITNQRETVVLWDKTTGKPVHKAIVWQDRRTSDLCAQLKADGHEPEVQRRTGLLLDPYFSSSKLGWLLDNVDSARAMASEGKLLFGTIDSWLIWNLTGGAVHATDATNAARTMLYNIGEGQWDAEMLRLLNIPKAILPDVRDCGADFGTCSLLGANIPIRSAVGDQQAATIGQACFNPGMLKSTYGTGCFALINTGDQMVASKNRLLTTIAYQFDGKTTYALEGSIFIAGAVVQWLRDGLGVIGSAAETQGLAEKADTTQDVIIVPAFTGLGAPYWNAESRGAVYGLTRNSGPAEMARAALESVGFQTRDLLEAMQADMGASDAALRVDGGLVANDWAMQFLSDILGAKVDRPVHAETTALGAAWVAGHAAGIYPDQDGFAESWALDRSFDPAMDQASSDARYAKWKAAIDATIAFSWS
ncbi:MAG: glycerol kinase GlpK [Pseudomonadota bacterium]